MSSHIADRGTGTSGSQGRSPLRLGQVGNMRKVPWRERIAQHLGAFVRNPSEVLHLDSNRPHRAIFSLFAQAYPLVLAAIVSIIIFLEVWWYSWWVSLVAITGYWLYTILKVYARRAWETKVRSRKAIQLRVVALVILLTTFLITVYTLTPYLRGNGNNDTLFLLYLLITLILSEYSYSKLLTPVLIGVTVIIIGLQFLSTDASLWGWDTVRTGAIKAAWIWLITFITHMVIRYVSDRFADLNLMVSVQSALYDLKDAETEQELLSKAVERIAGEFNFDCVNVFLKQTDGTLVCKATYGAEGQFLNTKVEIGAGIVGGVAQGKDGFSARYYATNNVDQDPYYVKHEYFPNTKAELASAMVLNDEIVGVLDIQATRFNIFFKPDAVVMKLLAGYLARVLDSYGYARGLTSMYQSAARTSELIESVAKQSISTGDMEDALEGLAKTILAAYNADIVTIFECDQQTGRVSGPVVATQVQLNSPESLKWSAVPPGSLVHRLMEHRTQYLQSEHDIAATSLESPFARSSGKSESPPFVEIEGIRSRAIEPLMLDTEQTCVGIVFINYRSNHVFTPEERRSLPGMANLVALALHNAFSYRQRLAIDHERTRAQMVEIIHNRLHARAFGISLMMETLRKTIGCTLATGGDCRKHGGLCEVVESAADGCEELLLQIVGLKNNMQAPLTGNLAADIRVACERNARCYLVNVPVRWLDERYPMTNRRATHKLGKLVLPVDDVVRLLEIVDVATVNSVRHGRATNIWVTVRVGLDESITLTIKDDGRGFSLHEASSNHFTRHKDHLGIALMRRYAKEMGGKVVIRSTPEKGTTVTVYLPAPTTKAVHLESTHLVSVPTPSLPSTTSDMEKLYARSARITGPLVGILEEGNN